MAALLKKTLEMLIPAFHQIEAAVPSPELVPAHGDYAFRYTGKSLEQALVQKLARVLSGLGAATVLLEHGFTQELGVLQRTLDELREDITFLCLPLHGEPRSELHQRYLDAFYEEEIDGTGDPMKSPQRRKMIPRSKIRAAIANSRVAPSNPSHHIEVHRSIDKVYSGFVHAASPHIMDMYGGMPPHFHVEGMVGTPRIEAARQDLWNYFYRGIACLMLVAICFRLDHLVEELMEFRAYFESESGWAPPPTGKA